MEWLDMILALHFTFEGCKTAKCSCHNRIY